LFTVCCSLLLVCAWAQVPVPPLTSPVTDLTGTLSTEQQRALEARLLAFEREKGAQIAVLIVPTAKPESIEQYSLRIAEAWKLGRKGVDDGALLLVAKEDRELRIEVGYGLEGIMPDAIANRIVDDIIVPHLRSGNFYRGIDAGISQMIDVISGEPLPEPRRQRAESDAAAGLAPAIMFTFLAATFLTRLFGRLPGALLTSLGGGFIVWLIAASLFLAIVVAIGIFMFSLFAGASPARGYGRRGGWVPGGWGHGSSGGGWGGGGGFGGGGGGFGGGGASGRW
jgi:uncharacterized protein